MIDLGVGDRPGGAEVERRASDVFGRSAGDAAVVGRQPAAGREFERASVDELRAGGQVRVTTSAIRAGRVPTFVAVTETRRPSAGSSR